METARNNDRSLNTLQSMMGPATSTSSLSTVTVTVSEGAPVGDAVETMWEGVLAVEGVRTDDNSHAPRVLLKDSLTWRDPPLNLMALLKTSEGHIDAEYAGKIEEIWRAEMTDPGRKGQMAIMARGSFDSGEFGQEVARLVGEGALRGVSVDLVATEWAIADGQTLEPVDDSGLTLEDLIMGDYVQALTSGGIGAATITPVQALADATIALVASSMSEARLDSAFGMSVSRRALTASAAGLAPLAPPREWFEVPEADEHTPWTVTKDGRAFGHLAPDVCHTAFLSCELPPRSASGYAFFHTGQIETAEGDLLNVGRVTVGKSGSARGGHASIVLGTQGAMEHYDSTGCTAAFVRAVDGRHGVWLSGAVRSDAPAEKIRDLRAHPLSGDWRPEKGGLELVAALAVPVGGFPIPRYEARLVASGGVEEIAALIATDRGAEPVSKTRADIRKLAVLGRKAREALTR